MSAAASNDVRVLRTPPHNTKAEKMFLGGVMVNNRALEAAGEYLRPEHFVLLAHGKIFEACAAVIGRDGVADPVSLGTILAEDESLAEMGGPGYLSKLAHSAVGPIAANEYGRIILDCYERRELIRLGENLLAEAYQGDATATAL
ncbi:MAG: replicative DNA helicase, partial [Proteobacteria bacterium]|nr:replicative DNA helicase [Pseudomonadota bacterium]